MAALWANVARSQAGVVSRAQLADAGLNRSAVDRLIRSGAIEPQSIGVYLVRGAPLSYEARLWVVVLATRGVLSHGTAAHLWGVIDSAPEWIETTLPPDRVVKPQDGVRLHRLYVPPKVITVRHGLPVTARTWTLLDHLGTLKLPDAATLADRALQKGWLTADDLHRRLRDYPGRYGNRVLRRLATATGDGAAAESERLLHRILNRAGITGWVANLDIWVNGEMVSVADVALPAARLALEVDGWAHHTGPDRFQRDRTKQNLLVAAGWTVLRFTWRDLVERPSYVVGLVRAQLDRVA